EGVNYGILKTVKDGVISAVGIMPNMPEAKNGYELLKDYSVCLGQHTNICIGKPLSDPSLIPTLVQKNGEFYSSYEIRQRKEDTIIVEEAEKEIQAQLDRFREITGKSPDYFEGHAIFSKNFFTALQNVAVRNQLFYCDPMDEEWVLKYGIECAEFYHLDQQSLYDIEDYIFNDKAKLKEKKCAVVVFHPGFIDQYLLDNSTYTLIRPMETEFLCSHKLKKYLKNNHIQVVDFKNYRGGVKK
ncbi:MAG: ChbG/HpnK family deacetylase, partial [Coprobacillus sp.]